MLWECTSFFSSCLGVSVLVGELSVFVVLGMNQGLCMLGRCSAAVLRPALDLRLTQDCPWPGTPGCCFWVWIRP